MSFEIFLSEFILVAKCDESKQRAAQESGDAEEDPSLGVCESTQVACKKILTLGQCQSDEDLRQARFFERVSPLLIRFETPSEIESELKQRSIEDISFDTPLLSLLPLSQSSSDSTTDSSTDESSSKRRVRCVLEGWKCTALLESVGWDILSDLWLLSKKDIRFTHVLLVLCYAYDSPRELFVLLPDSLSDVRLRKAVFLSEDLNPSLLGTSEFESGSLGSGIGGTPSSTMKKSKDGLSEPNIALETEFGFHLCFIRCCAILLSRVAQLPSCEGDTRPPRKLKHFFSAVMPHLCQFFEHLSKKFSWLWHMHGTQSPLPSSLSSSESDSTAQALLSWRKRDLALCQSLSLLLECTAAMTQLFSLLAGFCCDRLLPIIVDAFDLAPLALGSSDGSSSEESMSKRVDSADWRGLSRVLCQLFDPSPEVSDRIDAGMRGRMEEVLWVCKLGWSIQGSLYFWHAVNVRVDQSALQTQFARVADQCLRTISGSATPADSTLSPSMSQSSLAHPTVDIPSATKSFDRLSDASMMSSEQDTPTVTDTPTITVTAASESPAMLLQCRRLSEGLTSADKAKMKEFSKKDDLDHHHSEDDCCDYFGDFLVPFIIYGVLPGFTRIRIGNPPSPFIELRKRLIGIESELTGLASSIDSDLSLEFADPDVSSEKDDSSSLMDRSGSLFGAPPSAGMSGFGLEVIDEDSEIKDEDEVAVEDDEDATVVGAEEEDDDDWGDYDEEVDWGDDDGGLELAAGGGVKKKQTREKTAEQIKAKGMFEELQSWRRFVDLFELSCHLHSSFCLNGPSSMNSGDIAVLKTDSSEMWEFVRCLVTQSATTVCGVELAEKMLMDVMSAAAIQSQARLPDGSEDVLKGDTVAKEEAVPLLDSATFHSIGLWKTMGEIIRCLDPAAFGPTPMPLAVQRRLWGLVVRVLNVCDLPTRFQSIVSVALQTDISHVSALMFTELKNQIMGNWDDHSSEGDGLMRRMEEVIERVGGDFSKMTEEEMRLVMGPPPNPFVSRSLPMVFVQELGRVMEHSDHHSDHHPHPHGDCHHSHSQSDDSGSGLTLNSLERHLDGLSACLNVIRFVLMKDKRTNRTQIFDEDCPLYPALKELHQSLSVLTEHDPSDSTEPDTRTILLRNQVMLAVDSVQMCLDLLDSHRGTHS